MPAEGTHAIIVSPRGRFANVMFQHMLAMQLRRRLGNAAVIYGPGMAEWGWPAADAPFTPARPIVLRGHLFDLDEIAHCLRSGMCDSVVVHGWGMRVEFHPDIDQYRAVFRSGVEGQPIGDDEVLINIRAEDIESGAFPAYFPLPFDFYEAVARVEGRRPVFMGQMQPSAYVQALQRRFPGARYLPMQTPMEDFQTLRNARCVVLSISSFAWLGAWLSQSAQAIHFPVAGLFDPLRGDQNLLPAGDERYRFWSVEFPSEAERAGTDAAAWAEAPRQVVARSREWALGVARRALTRRVPGPRPPQ